MDIDVNERLNELEEQYGSLNKTLVGVNGNAFAILGHFKEHAQRAGWEKSDIDFVLESAKSTGDYNLLIATIMRFTE